MALLLLLVPSLVHLPVPNRLDTLLLLLEELYYQVCLASS
jgi:hypothetical protein